MKCFFVFIRTIVVLAVGEELVVSDRLINGADEISLNLAKLVEVVLQLCQDTLLILVSVQEPSFLQRTSVHVLHENDAKLVLGIVRNYVSIKRGAATEVFPHTNFIATVSALAAAVGVIPLTTVVALKRNTWESC